MAKDNPRADYSFQILNDEVSSKDLFSDKTHEKLAENLHVLIDNSTSGFTIGLEGRWGSGKSTVVNLLKKKMEKKQTESLFFVFDAWAHTGEPLRKVFLESLIDTCKPDNYLKDLKLRISGLKKTITTSTTKSVSKLGKRLAFSVLYIPIAAALLSTVKYESLRFSFESFSPVWRFWLGVILTVLPLLQLLHWRYKGDKDASTENVNWDIFGGKSTEVESQDISTDSERTSVEFEGFFKQIVSHIFNNNSQYKYNKLIIVIDNLDRLEPEQFKSVWATLQTFFQHRSSSDEGSANWINNIFFVVPYAREGIDLPLSNEVTLNAAPLIEGTVGQNAVTVNSSGINKERSLSAFKAKFFQVIIEVPPSIVSTWIEYFKKSIDLAYKGWPKGRKEEFHKSYIQCLSKLDSSPTPREMKNHINRAGALAMLTKDSVTAESINIYCLCRELLTESEFRTQLLESGVPLLFPTEYSEAALKAELAGLLFGVPAEKGMQLLLPEAIDESFSKGDGKTLSRLKEEHKEAFWLACRASSNRWMFGSSHESRYIVNVLNAYSLIKTEASIELYKETLSMVESLVEAIERWEFEDYKYTDQISFAIELINDKKPILEKLKSKLQRRLNIQCNNVERDNISENELRELSKLESLLVKNGFTFLHHNYEFLDLSLWEKWLNYCKKLDIQFLSVSPTEKVCLELTESINFANSKSNTSSWDTLINTYDVCSNKFDGNILLTELIKWFELPSRASNAPKQYKLAVLILNDKNNDISILKDSLSSQKFWRCWQNSKDNPDSNFLSLINLCDVDVENYRYIPEWLRNVIKEAQKSSV